MLAGQPVIDYNKCIGCNKCVTTCPKKVLRLIPRAASTVIQCHNPEKGAAVRAVCDKGCITCQLCVRKGPAGVYTLAASGVEIDFEKSMSVPAAEIIALRESCRPQVLHAFDEIKASNAKLLSHASH
jgi:ferredoxin